MRSQGGNIVVGLLACGVENLIRLQGREPFTFMGWKRSIHCFMDFNLKVNHGRRHRNDIPFSKIAIRVLGHRINKPRPIIAQLVTDCLKEKIAGLSKLSYSGSWG